MTELSGDSPSEPAKGPFPVEGRTRWGDDDGIPQRYNELYGARPNLFGYDSQKSKDGFQRTEAELSAQSDKLKELGLKGKGSLYAHVLDTQKGQPDSAYPEKGLNTEYTGEGYDLIKGLKEGSKKRGGTERTIHRDDGGAATYYLNFPHTRGAALNIEDAIMRGLNGFDKRDQN